MRVYPSFGEYLALRSAEESPDAPGAPVAERSILGGVFKAVNPSRPISPMNSRLLSLPGRKRLKSQVMGR